MKFEIIRYIKAVLIWVFACYVLGVVGFLLSDKITLNEVFSQRSLAYAIVCSIIMSLLYGVRIADE